MDRGTRLGPYEIVSAIGAGGMGEVYKARDTRLDRIVAIKILPESLSSDPLRRERFTREARAISALGDHPHICTLHDIGDDQGVAFLVMQYVEGETLADRLQKGPLKLADALKTAIEIAGALDHAHRHGIVHRDLKPANIMLARGGAKLLDFGLAKTITGGPIAYSGEFAATTRAELTGEGTILGTLQYMSPEQLDGRDLDARSDIFAFGAVLYEMVTGHKAFSGSGHASIIAAVMHIDPPPIAASEPLAPPELDRVVRTCLAKHPDDRWQTTRDLVRELRWIAEASPAGVRAPELSRTSRLAVAAAVAAAAVALTVLAGWRWRGGREALPVWASAAMRFSIAYPEGTNPANEQGNLVPPAVSPDGRAVAFVARGADGIQRLWVQSFDGAAHVLQGTEGATYPFWSPDSLSIGFYAAGKLSRMGVGGASVQVLAATPSVSLGAAWSRQDVIVYSTRYGLYQMSAAGGPSKMVAALDRSRQENSLRFPQFLPDGRRFLYVARSGRPENNVAYIGSLDGAAPTRLFATMSQVIYAPPGHLLFLRGRTLVARPFDARTLTLGAETTDVVTGVGGNSLSVLGAFSTSQNGVLGYNAPIDQRQTLQWFDRSGRALETVGAAADFAQFRIAPDGRRVIAAINDLAVGTRSLWLLDSDRPPTRLTFSGTHDWEPVWSPDGTRIAFGSYRDGPLNIYVRALSGAGGDQPLVVSDEQKDTGDWSADGRFFVYRQASAGNSLGDIWAVPVGTAGGEAARPIPIATSAAEEFGPRFSPDGRWVAYESDESGTVEVYVQPFPPTGGKWQVSANGGTMAAWGDHELFYLAPGGILTSVTVQGKGDLQLGKPTPLFRTPLWRAAAENNYDVTRDGARFLIRVPPPRPPVTPINVVFNWPALLQQK